jgi:hypothetical protein
MRKLNINNSDNVLFYHNPNQFRAYRTEEVGKPLTHIENKIRLYVITGIGKKKKKFNGKRVKICLVREFLNTSKQKV